MNTPAKTHIALIAMLNDRHEVLLLKRKSDVHCPDVWSFPGGKVEVEESALEAAKRELKEETNITGKGWQMINQHNHNYDGTDLDFSLFYCYHAPKGTAERIQAESEYEWCAISKLSTKKMPDANQTLVEMLLKFISST